MKIINKNIKNNFNFNLKKIIYIIMCYNFNNGYLGSHNDEERSEIR